MISRSSIRFFGLPSPSSLLPEPVGTKRIIREIMVSKNNAQETIFWYGNEMKATAKKGADKTIANNKETLTALYSCSRIEMTVA